MLYQFTDNAIELFARAGLSQADVARQAAMAPTFLHTKLVARQRMRGVIAWRIAQVYAKQAHMSEEQAFGALFVEEGKLDAQHATERKDSTNLYRFSATAQHYFDRANLSQVALAEQAHITKYTINRMLRGHHTRGHTAWKIAKAYATMTGANHEESFARLFRSVDHDQIT